MQVKNSISGLLLIIGVCLTGMLVRSDETKVTNSLLWEITGKKVKSPSYIFGTMHLISKDKFYFPETLENYVKSCDQLVMEIGGLADQMTATQLLFLTEGTLFELFSPAQKDTLLQFLNDYLDIDEATAKRQYNNVKPFVLMQLTSRMHFGEHPESYELRLETIAKAEEMSISGLETAKEQMAIFDNMKLEDQVEMVMASIRSIEEAKEQTQQLEELYLSQNIDSLYQFMHQDGATMMDYEDDLLTKRNHNWIPLIKKHIKKRPTFIAVGAGHLGGEEGVINLLRQKGYTVTPVSF